MFQRRLRILLAFLVAGGVLCSARLYQLQVLAADRYRVLVDAALLCPPEFVPPVRGRILDRTGRVLACDEPAHDVTVHYGVLSMDERYLARLEARVRREPALRELPAPAAAAHSRELVRERIAGMWRRLARAANASTAELRRRRDALCHRVETLRAYLWSNRSRRGFDEESPADVRLAEDEQWHVLLPDVSPRVRAAIEVECGDLPFLRVEPSVRRRISAAHALCHIPGRLGMVSAERLRDDPDRDDPLRRYRARDLAGVSGIERLAEPLLRGTRGMRQRDLDGRILEQVEPRDGTDVRLTIDAALQQRIVALLAEAVAARPYATGAACVVLRLPSREVLVAASYPVFDVDARGQEFRRLRDDARHRPLLFRAVAAEYPPGSIVKPAAMLAGLAEGAVGRDTVIDCGGRLFSEVDAWHCWTHWRHLPPHGPVDAVSALQRSCNIYLYTVGQRVGPHSLTDFYRLLLTGSNSLLADTRGGAGLIEERPGRIPSARWLRDARNRGFRIGDARNYALGQGELLLTPVQAANLFATLATGRFGSPTWLMDPPSPRMDDGGSGRAVQRGRSKADLPAIRPQDWATVREGLYRCASEPGGTAYNGVHRDDLLICGKTGSAQSVPAAVKTRFTFSIAGEEKSVDAPTLEAAREALRLPSDARPIDRKVVERWPPGVGAAHEKTTHAWFAGYAPREAPQVAIAVIIEHGGSGGRVAAPVAKKVFEALMDDPAGYLTRDAAHRPPRRGHDRESEGWDGE